MSENPEAFTRKTNAGEAEFIRLSVAPIDIRARKA